MLNCEFSAYLASWRKRFVCELWHHAGSCSSPRHNSWPGAVHVLPTSLLQPLMRLAQSFVLARPDMPDCPIVYASQRFLDLTGFPRCASCSRTSLHTFKEQALSDAYAAGPSIAL